MEISISYLAKQRGNPNISLITALKPQSYKGEWLPKLAPSYKLLMKYKEDGDQEAYKKEYLAYLDKLGPEAVVSMLKDGYTYCCFEKTGSFCHRHLLAQWLRANTDITIVKEE